MDRHAPLITKDKTKKITILGSTRIHKGSKPNEGWLRTGGLNPKEHEDLQEYKCINTIYKKHLHHAKKTHIQYKLNDNKNRTRNLYNILILLTKQKSENPMPPTESPSDVPNIFADFS